VEVDIVVQLEAALFLLDSSDHTERDDLTAVAQDMASLPLKNKARMPAAKRKDGFCRQRNRLLRCREAVFRLDRVLRSVVGRWRK
jgi:hypothetical protein